MTSWKSCKRILCVRPDNMGDLLMSSPAIRAVRETFGCHVTVLTSSAATGIASYLPGIDEVITWDAPWVKGGTGHGTNFAEMVEVLRRKNFDGAVIFTVFSQNPLPSALLMTLAGIPLRAAWCRENPYDLLSHWMPDEEPYTLVRHQVRRDLALVASIGAAASDDAIRLNIPANDAGALRRLADAGAQPEKPWLILHPGVSEPKRSYPLELWSETGRQILRDLDYQVIVTGTAAERDPAARLCEDIGTGAFNLAGSLTLENFISLIGMCPLVISVNTGTIHIASAFQTKTIVLYALTNPQHTPWKGIGSVLPYTVPEDLQSRNEVLRFVQRNLFRTTRRLPEPGEIVTEAYRLLVTNERPAMPELVF